MLISPSAISKILGGKLTRICFYRCTWVVICIPEGETELEFRTNNQDIDCAGGSLTVDHSGISER